MKLRLNAYANRRMMSDNPEIIFAKPVNGLTRIKLGMNLTQEQLALLGPTWTEPAPEVAESKKKSEISQD